MKKKALILACLALTSLASICLAQRGRFRGGRGFRGARMGRSIGARGFRGRRAFRGRPRFRHGRFRHGFRPGWRYPWRRGWWGRPGWRWRRWDRPYWRYRWCYPYCDYYPYGYGWWPGFGIGVSLGAAYDRDYYRDYLRDYDGETFWEITNNTPYRIKVKNKRGGPLVRIRSGDTKSLDHPRSFRFTVTSPEDEQTFRTRNHYISVEADEMNNLIVNSWSRRL